ncbi:MAG: magnesium transporter, partial [Rhodobacteraceae bacterium]|nr:magnesium transporter [Paracoccaceae bacterium]
MTAQTRLSDIRFDPADSSGPVPDIVAVEIARLLDAGETETVRGFLEAQEIADVAAYLDEMAPAQALVAMRLMALHDQAEVLGYMSPAEQVDIAAAMGRRELARVMGAMSSDERADLYKAMDPVAQEAILPALAQAERDDLRRLASFEEGTVGAIMTSDYAELRPEMTPAQALEALRHQALDSETVYTAYIVDEAHALLGVLELRDLLVARPRQRVGDIMDREPVFIGADAQQEEAARLIARYDLIALPVVDRDGRMVGIVTQDDAMDVAEEEVTEDIYKGSTVRAFEASVKDATIGVLYRARIYWLVLLVFGNIFSGAGIAYFEDTIAAHLSLLFFLPLLIASGGNAGTQSATLMVRALATGDVRPMDFGRLLAREVVIAMALGLTMAAAVSVIGFWRGGPEIALVVALA